MKQENKSSISALLNAGKKEAKTVNEIKSVAEQGSLASIEPSQSKIEAISEEISPIKDDYLTKDEIVSSTSANPQKKFEEFLVKKEYKDTENVRVPRSLHRQLKLIATASGCTMTQIVGNLLEDFYNKYPKEILACKKKLLQD